MRLYGAVKMTEIVTRDCGIDMVGSTSVWRCLKSDAIAALTATMRKLSRIDFGAGANSKWLTTSGKYLID